MEIKIWVRNDNRKKIDRNACDVVNLKIISNGNVCEAEDR